jgi:hypothetical protein
VVLLTTDRWRSAMKRFVGSFFSRLTFCCLLLNGLTRGTAAADPIFSFTDPQAFSDAVDIDSIETFDEFRSDSVIGLGSVTLDAIRYRSSDPSAIWFVEDSFVTNSQPNSLLTRNVIAPVTLTFGGQGFTDGIGFFFRPTNALPDAVYQFEVVGVGGEQSTETVSPLGAEIFRGFALDEGILSVTISPIKTNGISNFFLDGVSRGSIGPTSVPEPSTLVLGSTAVLIALSDVRRRRRQPPVIFLQSDTDSADRKSP